MITKKMKLGMKKALTAVLAVSMSTALFYVPGSPFEKTGEVEAATIGQTWTFNYTGGEQKLILPNDGIYRIVSWGAAGGWNHGNSMHGGAGGYVESIFGLSKGQELRIVVGQGGHDGCSSGTSGCSRTTQYGGGGSGGAGGSYFGGGGGGYSGAFIGTTPISIAGGGGGSMVNQSPYGFGGNGGGLIGGSNYNGSGVLGGVKGGSQSAGGSGFASGSSLIGGNSSGGGSYGGGGGGGGYYGGGAGLNYDSGTNGGGAGGSSYVNGVYKTGTEIIEQSPVQTATTPILPPRTNSPYYTAGVGASDNSTSTYRGGNGKLVIVYLGLSSTLSPATGTKFQNNYIDLSFVADKPSDSTITKYEIQAGTTLGGTNILALTNKGTTSTHRLAVPPGTAGNTTIYWQVRVTDSLGRVTPWQQSTVIYSNNVPKITATTNTPAKIDVSLERRHHQLSINSLIDPDDFNYVTLFADVLDSGGSVIAGSKQQIVLDADLMSNSASLIKGTATEKDGSLQGPFNHATKFNLKLYLEPNFTTGKFDLTLTKADGVTNVIKGDKKLLTGRTMQLATAPSPENYTLRIYPEDRQNTNTLANNPLASIPDVTHINMPFTSDTRNYLPRLTAMKDDVAERVFSDSQGFNKISVNGHVDDSDPADKVTIYYEIQPKAANYNIQVSNQAGKMLPSNGVETQSFNPKVNNDFAFTYQIDSSLDSREYALLVYGYDSQEGLGSYHEIPFTVDRGGPTIDFTADYTTSGGQKIVMSTAQKQIIAEDNIGKFYFTPNNYATFEYAGYLVRNGAVKDLRIRGAFTNKVKATFIGVDFGQTPITLMNGEKTEFRLGDVIVFKFKATSSTGIVTEKDVRILIGNDASTFAPLDDASLPAIP